MKPVLCTITLILVLPWNLKANTTLDMNSQPESTLRGSEPSASGNGSTTSQEETTTGSGAEHVSNPMHQSQIPESIPAHETTLRRTSTGDSKSSPQFSSRSPVGNMTSKSFDYTQNNEMTESPSQHITTVPPVGTIVTNRPQTLGQNVNKFLTNHSQQSTRSSELPSSLISLEKTSKVSPSPQPVLTSEEAKTLSEENKSTKTASNETLDPGTAPNSTSTMQASLPVLTTLVTTTTTIGTTQSIGTEGATTAKATSDKKTVETSTREKTTDDKKYTSIQTTTSKQTTTSTTQLVTTQDTKSTTTLMPVIPKPPKQKNNRHSPGPTVATMIGVVLILMLIAITGILLRQCRIRQKQVEDPDWAGPSPFIEGDHQPGREDGSDQNLQSKRISVYSFLPQQFSKRLSMVKETDDLFLEVVPENSTFGHHEQENSMNPMNGKPSADQAHENDTNIPDVDESTNSETVDVHPPPDNNVNVQREQTPQPDDAGPPPPPPEIEMTNSIQPSFEDVDLKTSPEENPESTTPSEPTDVPPP